MENENLEVEIKEKEEVETNKSVDETVKKNSFTTRKVIISAWTVIVAVALVFTMLFILSKINGANKSDYEKAISLIEKERYQEAYDILKNSDDERAKEFAKKHFKYLPEKEILTTESGKKTTADYKYDKFGNIAEKDGITYTYEYNKKGLCVKQKCKSGNSNEVVTEFIYDKNGDLVEEKHKKFSIIYEYDKRGNLIKMSNSNQKETKYIYDNQNNCIKEIEERNGAATIREFEYDEKGNRICIKHQTGAETFYKYDDDGNVVEISIESGALKVTDSYYYDEDGRCEKKLNMVEGFGTVAVHTYEYEGYKLYYNPQGRFFEE